MPAFIGFFFWRAQVRPKFRAVLDAIHDHPYYWSLVDPHRHRRTFQFGDGGARVLLESRWGFLGRHKLVAILEVRIAGEHVELPLGLLMRFRLKRAIKWLIGKKAEVV